MKNAEDIGIIRLVRLLKRNPELYGEKTNFLMRMEQTV